MGIEAQSEVFWRSNLQDILVAIKQTNDNVCNNLHGRDAALYRAGFDAAIAAMASAVGIDYLTDDDCLRALTADPPPFVPRRQLR